MRLTLKEMQAKRSEENEQIETLLNRVESLKINYNYVIEIEYTGYGYDISDGVMCSRFDSLDAVGNVIDGMVYALGTTQDTYGDESAELDQ